jgi:RNA polymerase sigma-70 factor, ECF subfamily
MPKAEHKSLQQEDERLLIEAAQRDRSRFGELFEVHARRVYAYVARRVSSREQAEDITSDVFHSALKNLDRYEYRGVPFSAWLFRIAEHAIAQHGRESAREAGVPLETEPIADADAEKRAVLFQLVGSLPDDQRRVVELRYAGQKSLREIADDLQRTEAAVKQLHYRAIQSLRKHMEGR